MEVALPKVMSRSEFLDWAQSREGRYEFDGLQPVAMTGGSLGHNQITLAIHRALDRRLAGGPCRPLGPDAGVATIADVIRYPDAVVTCSRFSRSEHLVPAPVIVFEVVSPGSLRIDRVVKLREYQAVPSIRAYVIVESDAPAVTVLSRDHDGDTFRAAGLTEDDDLILAAIDTSIPMAEIYAAIDFEAVTVSVTSLFKDEGGASGGDLDGETGLFDQAVALVAREGKASTSFIQRHLSIGYNRAAKLIEQMEKEGIVSPANHVGRREVLVRRTGDEE